MKLHVLRVLHAVCAAACVLHTGCSTVGSGALYSTLGWDPMLNTYLEVYKKSEFIPDHENMRLLSCHL